MTDAKNRLEEYVRGMGADELAQFAAFIAARAGASPDAPAPGVRQYVGARYVPVFANPLEWSDQTGYEPLTIVTYQGNSYTSMQSVPVGIDIGNTAYWALTGNYNAQIEAYRQEVLAFDGRIAALESKEAAAPNCLIVLGDSWANQNWTSAIDWITPLSARVGLPAYNYGNGGASFTSTSSDPAQSIRAQAVQAIADHEDDKPAYVVVVGGVNDFANGFNYINLATGIKAVNTAVQGAWPTAKVVFFQNMCLADGTALANTRLKNFGVNRDALTKYCQNNGINYNVSLVYAMLDDSLYIADMLHGSSSAIPVIASTVYNALTGQYNTRNKVNATLSSGTFFVSENNGWFSAAAFGLNDSTYELSQYGTNAFKTMVQYLYYQYSLNLFESAVSGGTFNGTATLNASFQLLLSKPNNSQVRF